MPATGKHFDVAVVGGGIIGLAVAWQASLRGLTVTVLERGTVGCGASRVAAGMLAPVAEAEFGDAARETLHLGLRSAAMWPSFAASLQAASGSEVPLRRSGTLVVARDADEARELHRQIALRDSLRLRTNRLRPSEARELEPALAPTVRLAMEAPEDHSVDPRPVVEALAIACEQEGVELRERTAVQAVAVDAPDSPFRSAREDVPDSPFRSAREDVPEGPRRSVVQEPGSRFGEVRGVLLADGQLLKVRQVVIAAGAWSGQIQGLPESEKLPVRPVKGQILRLRDPSGPGLLERVLRYEGGYVVPRGDGRYVLGASVEEKGFQDSPTAGGVRELLKEAWELLPGIDELDIEELSVGFRPGTPDNVPLIGGTGVDGLLRATGHYRNGILLAPLTAELVVQALAGEAISDDLDASALHARGAAT